MVTDWFKDWSNGERSPMMAGLNTMRTALNDRARLMLAAAGRLGTKSIDVEGKEFHIGDWIVARKNKHRLRGANNTYVKNGSTGTIVSIDNERNLMIVDFDREGVITLPDWYLTAETLTMRMHAPRTACKARRSRTPCTSRPTCHRPKRATSQRLEREAEPVSTSSKKRLRMSTNRSAPTTTTNGRSMANWLRRRWRNVVRS